MRRAEIVQFFVETTVYPQSRYPDRMFSWENFLLGCKNCNNAKVAHFPLDGASNPLLIDPSADEPLDYFVWDLLTGATGVSPTRRGNPAQRRHGNCSSSTRSPYARNAGTNL